MAEDFVLGGQVHSDAPYQGASSHKLVFEEITGFNVVSLPSNGIFEGEAVAKIVANISVVLVSSS